MPKKTKAFTGKDFEREAEPILAGLVDSGIIAQMHKLEDGLKRIGGGKVINAKPQPADWFGWTKCTGRIVLIEQKWCSGTRKSLPTERRAPRNQSEKCNGLHWHQLQALISVWQHGGTGLLIVGFECAGVWALDGLALARWLELGDGDKETYRGSISLKHCQQHGTALGVAHDWRLPADLIKG